MRCGYALAGNVTGVCPECGTAIPVPQLVRLRSELARQRERDLESGRIPEAIEHQVRQLDRLIEARRGHSKGATPDTASHRELDSP